MKKWTRAAEALTPDGKKLSLMERDGQFTIRLGGVDLMGDREVESERELARVGCEGRKSGAQILIGGLGLGFTLKAALEQLPPKALVIVAELLPAVVDWNRDERFPFAGRALSDPRVTLVVGDVSRQLEPERFDAILLDVDNGPSALTTESNASLYGDQGVLKMVKALRPGGRIVVWSINDDPAFTRRLARHGLKSRTVRVRAHAGSSATRTLFVGDK